MRYLPKTTDRKEKVGSRREQIYCLIDRRNRYPSRRRLIDQEIVERFERPMAIMITDSVGFTRRTIKYGIIQFMAVLKKVHDKLSAMMRQNHGIVLEDRPDNFLTVFDSPIMAVRTAIVLNQYLARYNMKVPPREQYEICTGIGYGPVLFGGDCVFGLEVNITSKLGEDLAKRREILLTEKAYCAVYGSGRYKFHEGSKVRIGGVLLKYHKLRY
jgi:class 3 adenylate cyclase